MLNNTASIMSPTQQLQERVKSLTVTNNRITSNVAPNVFVDLFKSTPDFADDCVILNRIISAEEETNTLGLDSLCRLADSVGCAMQLIVNKKDFTGKHKLSIGQLRNMFRHFGFKESKEPGKKDWYKRLPLTV